MNLGELIEHTRNHVLRDEAAPPLWSDTELTLYFNEAQVQFARRTHSLADETSDFTFLTTEAGVSTYELDSRIVFVGEIIHEDTGIRLRDTTRRSIPKRHTNGRPVAYALDAAMKSIRLAPTPDDEYVLDLLVARKPLSKLLNDNDEPEIDEDYHLTLCDWVVYRALKNNDPEQTNTVAAEEFKKQWEEAVRDAKRDLYRMRSGPRPKAVSNWTGKR
jgi:hypothetical protein